MSSSVFMRLHSVGRASLAGVVLATTAACAPLPGDGDGEARHDHPPEVGAAHRPVYALTSRLWTSARIPVCWEDTPADEADERRWVREAVGGTWEAVSGLAFTGWGRCADDADGIRIGVADVGPHTKGLGTHLDGRVDGMVLNFEFGTWSTGCARSEARREECIRDIAVHEFGHAIGLAHEHNRDDRDPDCERARQGSDGDLMIGAYDTLSVMNYCNPRWNGDGELSETDIEAVQLLYGLTGDRFGAAVATCDFDGDGFDDLAVGVPMEDVGDGVLGHNTGAVQIIYGSAGGLTTRDQLFTLPAPGGRDALGAALAAADFDADGRCDLAAGAPGRDGRGAVMLVEGSPTGLRSASIRVIEANAVPHNAPELGDRLGASLAAGDFDGDGFADLGIGSPGEDIGDDVDAGAVFVLWGGGAGIQTAGGVGINQSSPGQPGTPEPGDRFGAALVAGDFDDDGFDDLAIGAPGEDIRDIADAGMVTVTYGSAGGLSNVAMALTQDDALRGAAEAGDRLGAALAAADIDDEFGDDLVIGAPGEAVNGRAGAGQVHAVLGRRQRGFYYERVAIGIARVAPLIAIEVGLIGVGRAWRLSSAVVRRARSSSEVVRRARW